MVESDVVVHTFAISTSADSQLDALAQGTGGLSFLISGDVTSSAIKEGFKAVADQIGVGKLKHIRLCPLEERRFEWI